MPQENGARAGVRWCRLYPRENSFLEVRAGEPMMTTVSPYSRKMLEKAQHTCDLQADGKLRLWLDGFHMG
ncbi:MAG: hypothetical protein ACR2PT_14365 [Endozoicomonas sp.]